MTACAACGRELDPLRAGEVAFVDGRFVYFCDRAHKSEWLTTRTTAAVETAEPPAVEEIAPAPPEPHPPSQSLRTWAAEDLPASTRIEPPPPPTPAPRSVRVPVALAYLGGIAGAMATGVALLGPSADDARLLLAGVACLCAFGVTLASRGALGRSPSRLSVLAVCVAWVAAAWARAGAPTLAPAMASFAGIAAVASIAVWMAMLRAAESLVSTRDSIAAALATTGDLADVRPGEQLTVSAGERVPVDGVVHSGDALVSPWAFAKTDTQKREGAPVVAGARVVSGSLRITTAWTGQDRAFVKDSLERASLVTMASILDGKVLLPFAALAGGIAMANGASPIEATTCGAAALLAFGAPVASFAVWLLHARAHARALKDGIVYRNAAAFDRASRAGAAVLCARGTVLLGEPEIVTVEAVGPSDAPQVLALAAAVSQGSTHPFAQAMQRAAAARHVQPEGVRSVTQSGSGATALDAQGERVVVGRRAFLLSEKVSVAIADELVREHESQGRSVLLVARGGRVVGFVAFQDGIRAGARAAVQKLHDAHVEPVLLSGEARETCEAIGRALDVEHLRPEVAGPDRPTEVRALAEGGIVVAVVGHPSSDDGALGAADVSVALDAAGGTGEWGIALASDDVRTSAEALTLARSVRERSVGVMVRAFVPGVLASFLLAFQLVPAAVGPAVGALTAAFTLLYAKD